MIPLSSGDSSGRQKMLNRIKAIELALKDYKSQELNRTETIEFRGSSRSFPVVTINPEVPLLNPSNSRLRAQLANHPQNGVVKSDPNSPEAQSILQNLLSQTLKFEELKQQLVDFGQLEPGIISSEGLLVNGNTRLAAIRSLGIQGFDVAILPEDANDDDFFTIEMSLQLRNLVHQDYTFTNRLLLIDSHLTRTENREATIRAMQWKRDGKRKLAEHEGYLQLVEEIRNLNPKLSYAYFDTKEELIKNLYSQYISLVESSPKSAEMLKWTRIQAMLLGLNKDEVREIDEEFVSNTLLPFIEGDELESYLQKFRSKPREDSLLDELLGAEDGEDINHRAIAQDIAKQVVNDEGTISDANIESRFKKLHDQYRVGARRIREDRIAEEMRAEPVVYLKDVTLRIQELADQIPVMFEDNRFDKSQFEYQARKTEKAIQSLQDALKRKFGS
jgi:AcrR family transcriptional regulator